jgi:hypothetical protein
LDVGTDDDELLALAASLGCGVAVLDPEVKDVRAVDMTRCMNEEPNRPFVVFQVTASNITNPETLANITSNMSHPATMAEPVLGGSNSSTASLLGLTRPTMLNRIRAAAARHKKQKEEEVAQNASTPAKIKSDGELAEGVANSSQAPASASATSATNTSSETPLVPVEPMESAVKLDSIFSASNTSGAVVVEGPGGNIVVSKVSLLKVTPRSESAATLKALQGAQGLLKSGRVQCVATEMNFDLNTTEAFLGFVSDLEQTGFQLAHIGSLDYSELEVTDQGQYEVFSTDSKQLKELFDTYKRIRSFDERSGFRVYSGSLSLDRKGHYFDYSDQIFACKDGFPKQLGVLAKGTVRFRNGVWWLERKA